jgi:hypothetical protein
LHYKDRIIPYELFLGLCGLVIALLLNGGCVTHQVACQLDVRSCLTRQTLALDALDALSENGPIGTEDTSQLITPLMQGQGYVQTSPLNEPWTWTRGPKSHHQPTFFHVHVLIPGPESPCFRAALPQWLQWSREIPDQIDGTVSISTSEDIAVEGKESFRLILACGALPTQLELTVPSSPQGTVIEPWLKDLEKSNKQKETLVIRSPNTEK